MTTKTKYTAKSASAFLDAFIPTLDLTLSDVELQDLTTQALYDQFIDSQSLCNFQNWKRNSFIIKFKYNK